MAEVQQTAGFGISSRTNSPQNIMGEVDADRLHTLQSIGNTVLRVPGYDPNDPDSPYRIVQEGINTQVQIDPVTGSNWLRRCVIALFNFCVCVPLILEQLVQEQKKNRRRRFVIRIDREVSKVGWVSGEPIPRARPLGWYCFTIEIQGITYYTEPHFLQMFENVVLTPGSEWSLYYSPPDSDTFFVIDEI